MEHYNDLKTLAETKDYPARQVHLRRLGLLIVHEREDLFKFPILQFVEETAKIMLLNEFALMYWYHLMKKYLTFVDEEARLTHEQVRLFFFETAFFVKTFLYESQKAKAINF